MPSRNILSFLGGACAVILLGLTSAPSAGAQSATGTIRGRVIGTDGNPIEGAQIEARNTETGAQRGATTHGDGTYVLAGLVPAPYDMTVRRIGTSAQNRRVVVQIGATQIQDFNLTAVRRHSARSRSPPPRRPRRGRPRSRRT